MAKLLGVCTLCLWQEDRERAARRPCYPVRFAEVVAYHDPNAFDDEVTCAVALRRVDLCQAIDVDDHHRERVTEAFRSLNLLVEGGKKHCPGVERGHGVFDVRLSVVANLARRSAHVERRAAHSLGDGRPCLGRRVERFVDCQLAEGRAFQQVHHAENGSEIERRFQQHLPQFGDVRATRVECRVAHSVRQELQERSNQAGAIGGPEAFHARECADGYCVVDDRA